MWYGQKKQHIMSAILIVVTLLISACSGARSEVADAITKKDGTHLADLYNQAADEKTKKEIIEAINNGFFDKLSNDSEKNLLFNRCQDYINMLNFLDKVEDESFAALKQMKVDFAFIENENSKIARRENEKDSPMEIKNLQEVEKLDVYVVNRIKNAKNIRIGEVDLTDRYLDEFYVTSYRSFMGQDIPTQDWEAAVIFQKTSKVQSGVCHLYGISLKNDEKLQDSRGFEITVPVYREVTQRDIDYSRQMNIYRKMIEPKKNEINEILSAYKKGGDFNAVALRMQPKKIETGKSTPAQQLSNGEQSESSNMMEKLYGRWAVPKSHLSMTIEKERIGFFSEETRNFIYHPYKLLQTLDDGVKIYLDDPKATQESNTITLRLIRNNTMNYQEADEKTGRPYFRHKVTNNSLVVVDAKEMEEVRNQKQ